MKGSLLMAVIVNDVVTKRMIEIRGNEGKLLMSSDLLNMTGRL
jgi:hypothetical protein